MQKNKSQFLLLLLNLAKENILSQVVKLQQGSLYTAFTVGTKKLKGARFGLPSSSIVLAKAMGLGPTAPSKY